MAVYTGQGKCRAGTWPWIDIGVIGPSQPNISITVAVRKKV